MKTSTSISSSEELVITTIRARDVALGLGRLPAGFYAVVHHGHCAWRTENRPSSVNDDVVEWSSPLPIPSDASATMRFEVYASFEFEPTLGIGEQLRNMTVTVGQLLERSEQDVTFTFFPKDGDVVSPCSSVSVTVKPRSRENGDSSSLASALDIHWSPPESRDELEDATDRGHGALARYRKHGHRPDLEHSVQAFERALDICSLGHPCRPAAQCNLAMAKFLLCLVEDGGASLEVALWLYYDALAARPVGHPDRPSTLIQLAVVHLARFQKRRDHIEEVKAEALLREAAQLCSTESHEQRAATVMLQLHAQLKVNHVQPYAQLPVEQNLISPLWGEDLWTCSVRLLQRFERFADLADLGQAIALLEESVRSTSIFDDRHLTGLANLAVALSYRFEHLGALSDLEDAISRQRDAVCLTPHSHPNMSSYLNNLGSFFRLRFERLGRLGDLEDAIAMLRNALDLTPHDHPGKPVRLNSLGISFRSRFERLGDLSNLENAISTLRDAVDLTSHYHPDKPGYLNNLGVTFFTRFGRLGESNDLQNAILALRDAARLTPDDHPHKHAFLNNLGTFLRASFEHLGRLSDLEDAISTLKDAVDITPNGHPNMSSCLDNLASCFAARFERLGRLSDLEDAISRQRAAVDLTPQGHPEQAACLQNLGKSLRIRFERLGQLNDIEDAVSILRKAADLTPDAHHEKPSRLNNLGASLLIRFQRVGQLSDIEDAILTLRNAVDLTPHSHPDRPIYFDSLGASFRARFEHRGQLSDLENAISILRDAVDLTGREHPSKPGRLNHLGISFLTRFQRLGELTDLQDAITVLRNAVSLTPHHHPHRASYLTNLGNSLGNRFEHLGRLGDLDDAISTCRDAVELTPDDHHDKHRHLNNLGNSLKTRFERVGRLGDLEDAISAFRHSVELTPRDHLDKPVCLSNLGNSLRTRFERLGQLSDLEDAISTLRDAVELTLHGHPHKLTRLINLGHSFRTLFVHFGKLSHLEQAIALYSHAASAPVGPIDARFGASQMWIACARRVHHHSLLHGYSVAISLLPQLAWIGLSLTHRYNKLTHGADVAREGAAAALDAGLPETAVEWLEHGRSIVWGELFQLRSSYEELSSAHPDHAKRLGELSAALDHAAAAREQSWSSISEHTRGGARDASESPRAVADRHRALAIERDELLQEIRRLPGFEQFLLRKRFSQLRASAHSGPVVVLNAAKTRCDALVVLADVDRVLHVPLPSFTFRRSAGIQNALEKLLGHARAIPSDDRQGDPSTRSSVSWQSLLSTSWMGIVKPVLDALAFPPPGEQSLLSRIFWCPTGPFAFLPVHAAGVYDARHSQPGHKVSDFVVSSYVPSLGILALPSRLCTTPSAELRLLVVRQPPSDGLSPLRGVPVELSHIQDIVRNAPSSRTTLVVSSSSSVGTVEEVLGLMSEADWVHFACHGIQDGANSGLCLADGRRLKLRDIIALTRPGPHAHPRPHPLPRGGGLAFLSACQTAMGEARLSDEAIHVAAGMLFAGYGGVIGTMWSISDRLAPVVARDVYARLLGGGGGGGTRPDHREAARALHEAVGRLREGHASSFVEWVPFVHVGL